MCLFPAHFYWFTLCFSWACFHFFTTTTHSLKATILPSSLYFAKLSKTQSSKYCGYGLFLYLVSLHSSPWTGVMFLSCEDGVSRSLSLFKHSFTVDTLFKWSKLPFCFAVTLLSTPALFYFYSCFLYEIKFSLHFGNSQLTPLFPDLNSMAFPSNIEIS